MHSMEITLRQFIRYCFKSLFHKSINIWKRYDYIARREVSFDDLNKKDHEYLKLWDHPPSNYEEGFERLYNAIQNLPKQKKQIIILSYWDNLSDQQIADRLKIVRRTVNYKRHQSLKALKCYLEDK